MNVYEFEHEGRRYRAVCGTTCLRPRVERWEEESRDGEIGAVWVAFDTSEAAAAELLRLAGEREQEPRPSGPLYLDAEPPAAGRRPHWAYVRDASANTLLPILLDNHLSTEERRTTDEEHATALALALARELVGAANMVRRLQAHPVLYRLVCRYPDTVAALLASMEAIAAEELDR